MTTSTGDLEITYEGEALTFGGYVSADFFVTRPGHPGLEVNLGLAADAQALRSASKRRTSNFLDSRVHVSR